MHKQCYMSFLRLHFRKIHCFNIREKSFPRLETRKLSVRALAALTTTTELPIPFDNAHSNR